LCVDILTFITYFDIGPLNIHLNKWAWFYDDWIYMYLLPWYFTTF